MNAIILIGGFGTRLRPLTLTEPKALLPVLNRPFLSYQLDLLKEAGVSDVMLACGLHTRPWKKAFQRLAPRGINIHFAFEPKPLGTGGAIRFAYSQFMKRKIARSRSVLVFNGDVFFDLPVARFLRFHDRNNADCTVALTRVKDPSRFGLVEIDRHGRVITFLEKPKPPFPTDLINAGAYLLGSRWIESIPSGRAVSIERESFPRALSNGEALFGFPMRGYWNDIGTHQSYLQAHHDLLFSNNRWTPKRFLRKRGHPKSVRPESIRVVLGRGCRLEKSVVVHGFLSCGNDVRVGPNVVLENSVILSGCRVDAGAVVRGAVLGRRCRIGANAQLRAGSVLGNETKIPPYTWC